MMVKGFMRHAEKLGAAEAIKETLSRAIVGAIGTPTGKTLQKHGINVDVIPEEFTFEALLKAIKKNYEIKIRDIIKSGSIRKKTIS